MTLPARITAALGPAATAGLGSLEALRARLSLYEPRALLEAARARGLCVSVYRPFTNVPYERLPLGSVHADAAALSRALEEGEPGTWDAALDLLAALDDAETDRLAGAVLAARLDAWPELGERARALLERSKSDAALEGLLAGHRAGAPLRLDLASHPHPALGARLYEALRSSDAATFTPFVWPTVAEHDAMSAAERESLAALVRERERAAHASPEGRWVCTLLGALRRLDHAPSLPERAAMARAHPLLTLRRAALTSLLGLERPAPPEAASVLRASLTDAYTFDVGVFYVVRHEPERAFELLSPGLLGARSGGPAGPCARRVAATIVSELARDAHERGRATDAGSGPSCLAREPRWLELAVALEGDDELGTERLVRAFDARDAARARAQARAARPRREARGPLDALARYQAGAHEEAWRELQGAGELDDEPALRDVALAVARETMRRVRHNVELIAERLRKLGYAPPGPRVTPACLDALAAADLAYGPLPPSLFAFYEVLGSVSLAWDDEVHDKPTKTLALLARSEPLVVGSLEDGLAHLSPRGEPRQREPDGQPGAVRAARAPRPPVELWLAPDPSGGRPVHTRLPSHAADAVLLGERHRLPFVAYLRLCLAWGGFPGLERAPKRPRAVLARLTRDLEPF